MRAIHRPIALAVSAALWGSLGATSAAWSQEENLALEEVIVFARKKDELLQDTPLTINAFTDEMLDDRGITSLESLADATPGFDFAQAFGRQDFRPAIRGQSTILGGANAGLFVDGFYIGRGGPTLPLGALQSVEVVKGPQSALYGRSTMAGAINYTLKKPTTEFEGAAEVTAAEDGEYRTDITVSGPISDKLGYMVAGSFYTFDGQYTNNYVGNPNFGKEAFSSDLGGEETISLVSVLEFQPTESLQLLGRVMYEDSEDDPYAIALQSASANNCFVGQAWTPPDNASEIFPASQLGVSTSSPYNGSGYYCGRIEVDDVLKSGSPSQENNFYSDMGTQFEALRIDLTANWDINDFLLTYNVGYHDYHSESRQDQTYGAVKGDDLAGTRFGFITDTRSDAEEMSHELRLTSPDEGKFRYMTGVYYYQFKQDGKSRGSSDGPTGTEAFGDSFALDPTAEEERSSWSVFGQVEYDFTESLTGTFEIRYNEEKVEALNVTDYDLDASTEFEADYSETYEAVLPRATLSWAATQDVIVYGTVARGNKPGDFNTQDNLNPNERAVNEEKAWSYELGTKTTWLDGALTVNVAAFYIDWEDQQLTTTTTPIDGAINAYSVLDNIGESTIQGFELEANARLTQFWDVYLGYAYTDTEIKEYLVEPSWNILNFGIPPAGVPDLVAPTSGYKEGTILGFDYDAEGNVVVEGTSLPQVSKDQVVLSNTFHGALTDMWDWRFRVDYLYSSPRYAQVYELTHTGHRNVVNLRAGIYSESVDLEAWVDNLEDDNTPTALIRYVEPTNNPSAPTNRAFGVTLPKKRQAGITVRYRF